MSYLLADGRKVLVFNGIDDFNWESIASEAPLSYPSRAVIKTLENLKEQIGVPKFIRCDKVTEFTSKALHNGILRTL